MLTSKPDDRPVDSHIERLCVVFGADAVAEASARLLGGRTIASTHWKEAKRRKGHRIRRMMSLLTASCSKFPHVDTGIITTVSTKEHPSNMELAAASLPDATYEYPGYISVNKGNTNFAFGDVDGPIGYDFGPIDDPGGMRGSSEDTIPADSSVHDIRAFVLAMVHKQTGVLLAYHSIPKQAHHGIPYSPNTITR